MHLRDRPPGGRPLHERQPGRPPELTIARPSAEPLPRPADSGPPAAGRSIPMPEPRGPFEPIAPIDDFEPVEFESVDAVAEALRAQGYIADTRLATTVFLLTRLDKPLLV